MKLHYLHPVGGHRLSAPSGKTHEFKEDDQGRRVAEFDEADPDQAGDAAWFLKLKSQRGADLFVVLDPPEAPAEKSAATVSRRSRKAAVEPTSGQAQQIAESQESKQQSQEIVQ